MLIHLLACGTPLAPPVTDTGIVLDTSDPSDSGDTAQDTGELVLDEEGAFLYGDVILDFDLGLTPSAIESLRAEPREDVLATFRFLDESYEVGVRLKGSGSFRDIDGKASFKIDFEEWDDAAPKFHGVRRLTLNNMVQDASMSAEHASYALHALVGNVAPRHGYARVSVNGEPYGLYGIVETLDEQFLERNFPGDDEGNLYEGGYGGDFAQGCAPLFTQQEGDDETQADLDAAIDAFLASSDATFMEVLRAHFDVDDLLTVWAVELVTGNVDAYTSLGNNFQVYRAPATGLWTMIPTGTDQAFRGELDVRGELYGALAVRCRRSTECSARLDERILRVLGHWEEEGFAARVRADGARIERDCRADPRSPFGDYGCRDAIAALNAWAEARPDVVRGQMGR
jgi:spore coat protein CotH